ncbi:hypothetical protein HHE01_00010 [Helicobacter heilmannii]|uniref:Uncharacterized protein n=1 Tax=Helicobacter heilmannii TaxID=35817 RepID=A0A0K2YAX9_HELHE|nr:hypothetical protein HHE01_00010 [Helicobacter heilmannii]
MILAQAFCSHTPCWSFYLQSPTIAFNPQTMFDILSTPNLALYDPLKAI